MKRIVLVLTGVMMVAALIGLGALSSAAQEGALDTGGDQYQDNGQYQDDGALDTGNDGALDTGNTSPAAPQCDWYYNTAAGFAPWWEYWCWWPGWGWQFVFWVWA